MSIPAWASLVAMGQPPGDSWPRGWKEIWALTNSISRKLRTRERDTGPWSWTVQVPHGDSTCLETRGEEDSQRWQSQADIVWYCDCSERLTWVTRSVAMIPSCHKWWNRYREVRNLLKMPGRSFKPKHRESRTLSLTRSCPVSLYPLLSQDRLSKTTKQDAKQHLPIDTLAGGCCPLWGEFSPDLSVASCHVSNND